MSLKDNLRQLTVGRKNEFKTIEMDYEGEVVVFKQPSLKLRKSIVEKSFVNDKVDGISLQVWSVIYLTYDAEGNRVFDEADFEALMEKPAGSFVDVFAEQATKLLGNGEKELEDE